MSVRGPRAVAFILSIVLFASTPSLFSQQLFDPLEAFNANGFDQNRDYFSGLPTGCRFLKRGEATSVTFLPTTGGLTPRW